MNDNLPARISDLPSSLVDVAETLGQRVALALVQHFGGLEVKFPVRPRPDHPVIKALGETDGYALCAFLGGQQIYVPHIRPARSVRDQVLHLRASESGGDTATAEGLALRIVDKKVPESLLECKVYSLDMTAVLAGTLPTVGLDGLWLQADGCCSKASWVGV